MEKSFAEALNEGTKRLEAVGITDAKNDAWLLLQYAAKIDHNYYFMHMKDAMSTEQTSEYENVISKRCERVPLQYITGEQEFMGLSFFVNSNVLVPRQDTETLVEEALKTVRPGMKILDMCTGSGCIIASILKLAPGTEGVACDVSKQALLVAKENLNRLNLDAELIRSNLFENIEGQFDCIVSNPPYIRRDVIPTLMPEVEFFEPIIALDGGEDGLDFYRTIIKEAPDYLYEGGSLLFEIGYDQGEAVSEMMRDSGFYDVEVIRDLAGNDRVVKGHLLVL